MERHAHFALVGVIATAILIAALVFVVWLGRAQFNQHYDEYRIVFRGPVRGLSQGGEVQFNGIKVGQIQRIALDQRDPNRVVTDVQLDGGTPVRVDSLASTETQGISGVSVIQISAGSATRALLKESSRNKRPVIRSKANALSSLLQGGGQMIENATEALSRVNRLLSDRNLANLTAAVEDVRATTSEIAANRAMFVNASSAIAKLDRAATDIQGAAATVRDIAAGDGRRTFADVSSAARDLKLAIGDARGMIANLEAQSSAVGSTTLPNINATMLSLQETAESLDALIRQVRQNPRAALSRGSGKELELPR
ncbi:MAG: MlaD family protein [Sphingobium sp.]|uniref:MlaD family protein n=1 Tax=Sphingobium sp. TaxID=1912891 RepID=UPI0029AD8E19|nr:MlaD family protein [Sphingobium sp.]MDX3910711.1 MlaD family protein [Sphingobium sp.]